MTGAEAVGRIKLRCAGHLWHGARTIGELNMAATATCILMFLIEQTISNLTKEATETILMFVYLNQWIIEGTSGILRGVTPRFC